MPIKNSELILNSDGSIYHLNLLPNDISDTIITVGDPERVAKVSQYFDTIEIKKHKREFHTHTGTYKGKRITVISTGIGTDNIDIVLNELDALVNINFETREIHNHLKSLDIIRIGTSGAIQKNIEVDSYVISELAVGFDSLLHFYNSETIQNYTISNEIVKQTNWSTKKSKPYVVEGNSELIGQFSSVQTIKGFTATNAGFYAPQGRVLRLQTEDKNLNNKLTNFNLNGIQITNLEMETAGIYGLSILLGHKAVSLNAILANRMTGHFSKNPSKTIDNLIQYTLNKLTE